MPDMMMSMLPRRSDGTRSGQRIGTSCTGRRSWSASAWAKSGSMPVILPFWMKDTGGESGDVPTRIIAPAALGAGRAGGDAGPQAATSMTASARTPRTTGRVISPPPHATARSLERELHALGRRLQLHTLAGRVQRDADAVAVLQAGYPFAPADGSRGLDRGVRPLEVAHAMQVVDVPDRVGGGDADGVHRQPIHLERVVPPSISQRAVAPLKSDTDGDRLALDSQGGRRRFAARSPPRVRPTDQQSHDDRRHDPDPSDHAHDSFSFRCLVQVTGAAHPRGCARRTQVRPLRPSPSGRSDTVPLAPRTERACR